MSAPIRQTSYFVVFIELKYRSLQEVRTQAPESLAAHLANSKLLHQEGLLVMSGAFLDKPDEPLHTMGVLTTREAAENYIQTDPFYKLGMMSKWEIREWANMFA